MAYMLDLIGTTHDALGCLYDGLQCRLVAEAFELADQSGDLGFPGAGVEVGRAEVDVSDAFLEHVIDRGQDRSGDSADGLLRAALGLKAEKLGAVVAVLDALGGR